MKKFISVILTLCLMATVAFASGCKLTDDGLYDPDKVLSAAPAFVSKKLVGLDEDTSTIFLASDARGNGDPFGVIWSENNVKFDKDEATLTLSVDKRDGVYYGGELKTIGTAGAVQYGYFGCKMKPSNVVGTASTFFTYTGEYENNPHDEIDIEFLGKDTTRVQFNYFVEGQGGHEYMYELGFDASEDFHDYGFYWDENTICWYVDGKAVYAVRGRVPANPQRVYMNFWAGEKSNEGIMAWMGELSDSALPAKTVYKEVNVAYLNGRAPAIPVPEYIPEGTEFNAFTMTFDKGSTDVYSVTANEDFTASTISYDRILPKTYKNVYGILPEEVAKAKFVTMKIRNNKPDDYVKVRADVMSETANAAGIKVINDKAWMDGETVKTDLKYGGSFFDIPAGEEVTCIIRYVGIPSRLMFMIDSCARTDKEFFAGSITVSSLGYAGENDFVEQRVTLSSNYEVLSPGGTVKLIADATGEVEWSSDNENVATVKDGIVSAIGEGVAEITAKCGYAAAKCTVKVSSANPKDEETSEIISDDKDYADVSKITRVNGTCVTETENTYGKSAKGLAWSGATAGESLYFMTPGSKVTTDGYIEFFVKNVGHTPSSNGETINGLFIVLYDSTYKTKLSSEVKAYKEYNSQYRTEAGNLWYKYKLPLSLFTTEGVSFAAVRFKMYAAMNEGETLYIDGVNIVCGKDGEQPVEPSAPSIDHSEENLPICADSEDVLCDANKIYVNGVGANETENVYGSSLKGFKWTGINKAYDNMMFYAKADKSTVTVEDDCYIEFFIKNVGHTSSSSPRASGIVIRLYNGSNSTKADGANDVKAYKDYGAEYRTDAGNGWSYYKIPLSALASSGASFDRIRISANSAFDAGEAMYIDGLRVFKAQQ